MANAQCTPGQQLLVNPSFESGNTGWVFVADSGSIIADSSAPDGGSILRSQLTTLGALASIQQPILPDTSSTYTLSLSWRLSPLLGPPTGPITCQMSIYNTVPGPLTTIAEGTLTIDPTSPTTPWTVLSANWQPPTPALSIVVSWTCATPLGGVYVDLDNVQMTCLAAATTTTTSTTDTATTTTDTATTTTDTASTTTDTATTTTDTATTTTDTASSTTDTATTTTDTATTTTDTASSTTDTANPTGTDTTTATGTDTANPTGTDTTTATGTDT
ncbi:hypothetical protein LOZ29_003614, partial [Ophidiomyces ophidiicola]